MKISTLNKFKNRTISIKWFSKIEDKIKDITGFVSDVDRNGITLEYTKPNNTTGLKIIPLDDIREIEECGTTEISNEEKKKFREEIKKVIKMYEDPYVPLTLPSIIKLCLTYRKWDKYRVIEELESMLKDGEFIRDGGSLMFSGEEKGREKLDIDRIVTGITTSQRSRIITVRELIKELESRYDADIPLADVIDSAKDKGIEESRVEEIIEKMKREGELFEPKHGMIRRYPKGL